MREDVIDIVMAKDVEPRDHTIWGEVVLVEEVDEDHVRIVTEDWEEGIVVRWDDPVKLFGDIAPEI